ncbi:bHLH transcription factor RHL1-like [Henckelia pumila]|uniref:bHLH transcription factor RHL1-like n=1 Tax=Henckelia pumila TaxID=405737 RepID=UPI003C6E8D7E
MNQNNAFCDTGSIEELNHQSALEFLPVDWMANNSSLVIVEDDVNQHYVATQGTDGIFQVPVSMPQLIRQTPQNYVKFLAESGYPEIQNVFSPMISAPIPSLALENHSQKQDSNEDYGSVFQAYLGSGATALKCPSKASRKRSREKAYAADRSRRLKISQRLEALQDMFPQFKQGGKADLLDHVVDQLKYLQYQVKDLCQSKLGGEPSSSSFIFLEGHGHYLVSEQMLSGSLEEMMGKLLELYPSAALELLQSKGLVLMPMTFAGELCESIGMLDMQEKAHFYPPSKFWHTHR